MNCWGWDDEDDLASFSIDAWAEQICSIIVINLIDSAVVRLFVYWSLEQLKIENGDILWAVLGPIDEVWSWCWGWNDFDTNIESWRFISLVSMKCLDVAWWIILPRCFWRRHSFDFLDDFWTNRKINQTVRTAVKKKLRSNEFFYN